MSRFHPLLSLLAGQDLGWQEHAACQYTDPDLWYPEKGEGDRAKIAKRICATCPVREPCLEYGLNERFGIYGGKSERERRPLRRGRSQEQAA